MCSKSGIYVLIIAFAIINGVQSVCDSEMCNNVCNGFNMNGTCNGNECDCYSGKNCSELICDAACKVFKLDGECDDNDQCICKAELEPCEPFECQGQCLEDPRARECIIVIPVACLDYGPVRTCVCECYVWQNRPNNRFNIVHKKKTNHFVPNVVYIP